MPVLWVVLLLIVIIAMSMALSVFLTRRHPQQVFASPTEYGLEFEEIEFTTADHISLRGWWIPAENSKRNDHISAWVFRQHGPGSEVCTSTAPRQATTS